MNYRITNAKLLLQDENGFRVEDGNLTIENGIITTVETIGTDTTGSAGTDTAGVEGGTAGADASGAESGAAAGFEAVDAKGHLVMPGLINAHTHAYMTILRNYADDVDFGEWLFNRVMPVEDQLPAESAYWLNLLAFAEMFQSGTTSYVDMHMYRCMSGKAAQDAGIRAFIGRGLVGTDLFGDGLSRFEEAMAEKKEYESDRIRFILSPHAPYSCSEKLYRQVMEEAEKQGLMVQTHLSEGLTEVENVLKEHGKTPVQWLYDIGFLKKRTLLAHCVQMREDDLGLIAKSGASVVTNPASNAKLGNGFAPVTAMDQAGINVCLGTDGTSSNNTLNMFREMGLLSLIHKGLEKDSTAMPAQKVIAAATANGARALNMENRLGVIAPGAKADLIFLDLKAPSLFPNNNIVSSLVYSANGSEVRSVMVDGAFVMKNRELLTIDYERVCYEVAAIQEKML